MSATGRGANRDPKDFYPTPYPSFAPLLEFLPRDVAYHDPCAGDGRLVRYLNQSGRLATGDDLYPQLDCGYGSTPTDYLQDTTIRDFVLTNPPFSVAFEMCQHAERHSVEFMFLLRLSFLESKERATWLSKHEPSALFVLAERPSFVMSITCKGDNYPDSVEVAGQRSSASPNEPWVHGNGRATSRPSSGSSSAWSSSAFRVGWEASGRFLLLKRSLSGLKSRGGR